MSEGRIRASKGLHPAPRPQFWDHWCRRKPALCEVVFEAKESFTALTQVRLLCLELGFKISPPKEQRQKWKYILVLRMKIWTSIFVIMSPLGGISSHRSHQNRKWREIPPVGRQTTVKTSRIGMVECCIGQEFLYWASFKLLFTKNYNSRLPNFKPKPRWRRISALNIEMSWMSTF